ncbi:MAG: hypothetical protein WCJ56_00025 [bacterium]
MTRFNILRIAGLVLVCTFAAPLLLRAQGALPAGIPASTISSDSAFVRAAARPGFPSTLLLDGNVSFASDMGNITCDHLEVLAVPGANFSTNLKEEDISSMKAYGNVKFDAKITTDKAETLKDATAQSYERKTHTTSNYSGKGGAVIFDMVDGVRAFRFVDGAGITDAHIRPEFHLVEVSNVTERGVQQPTLNTKADYNANSFVYYPNAIKTQQAELGKPVAQASKKILTMQSSGSVEFIAYVDSMKDGAKQTAKYEGHAPMVEVSYLLKDANGAAYDRVAMLDNTPDKLKATKPSALINDVTDAAKPRVIASMTANHIDVNLDATEMNATGGVSIGYQPAPEKSN